MRQLGIRRRSTAATAAAVPAAVAGSIALLLSGPPAQAAPVERETRMPLHPVARAVPVAAAQTATPDTWVVRRGDTVFGIAMRHGLRTADVLAINGLTYSSLIHPGQVLRLRGTAPTSAPAPAPSAPTATAGSYTIVRGDTLSGIARRHGVTVQVIFSANGLGWSSIIYPGQKIAIPGGAASKAPPAVATPPAPVPPSAVSGLPKQVTPPRLDDEQIGNVRLIMGMGRELGVPSRGIAIAIGAAMQESSLRNLGWGDRDSLGLFQQRPSAGWGTEAQVSDAARAVRAFFGGPSDPNGSKTRGLLEVRGWETMTFTQAAQAVQISAHPDLYARWELSATTWLSMYG